MGIIYSLVGEDTPLREFYASQGLECDMEGAFYSAEAKNRAERIGAVTLSRRFGIVVLDYIAVLPAYRHQNIGSILADMAIAKAKEEGKREVYLVTKAEGFFAKLGAVRTKEHSELLEECLPCSEYNKNCFPVLMKVLMLKH